MTKYYRTPHLVYDCKYHVVFCPKYRRRILVNGLDELVKKVFKEIARQVKLINCYSNQTPSGALF